MFILGAGGPDQSHHLSKSAGCAILLKSHTHRYSEYLELLCYGHLIFFLWKSFLFSKTLGSISLFDDKLLHDSKQGSNIVVVFY